MTAEMKQLIDRELDAALESGDPNAIDRAIINAEKAVVDCQLKTSERVKIIANDHPTLMSDVSEIKSLVAAARRKVWQVALNAVKWIILGGGATEFIHYLATR